MARSGCWGLLVLLAMEWGCTRPCREGTVFLELAYDANLRADTVRVMAWLDGGLQSDPRSFSPNPGEDSIELNFPEGYREGATLEVKVEATLGGARVGGGEARDALRPGCTVVRVQVRSDVEGGVDMAVPPGDMAVPSFTPSHLTGDAWTRGSANVIPRLGIDTSVLTIDGTMPPAGVSFTDDNGLAVLAVQNFTVAQGSTVRVTGARPLVVVARENIIINGILDGSAHNEVPGPGGAHPGRGQGIPPGIGGGTPPSPSIGDVGGSGAGHGASGGRAGSVNGGTQLTRAEGSAYGDDVLTVLQGGAGGGFGTVSGACPSRSGTVPIYGGAGGGAIQLTAGQQILINGQVNVGGGGGRGGCVVRSGVNREGSGGGGGSGGALLVEALSVDLRGGTLAANGGGGGGGANGGTLGRAGQNGRPDTAAAGGGAGASPERNGGVGGNYATRAGGSSSSLGKDMRNSGGGGGAVGRIYIRSRGNVQTDGTTIVSPVPATATNL